MLRRYKYEKGNVQSPSVASADSENPNVSYSWSPEGVCANELLLIRLPSTSSLSLDSSFSIRIALWQGTCRCNRNTRHFTLCFPCSCKEFAQYSAIRRLAPKIPEEWKRWGGLRSQNPRIYPPPYDFLTRGCQIDELEMTWLSNLLSPQLARFFTFFAASKSKFRHGHVEFSSLAPTASELR